MAALQSDFSVERRNESLVRAASSAACTVEDLVMHGSSPAIQRLRQHIETAASLPCPVFVRGSIGDGAMVVANAIHRQSSSRNRPLIHLDCSLRFRSEAEAVLFGASGVKGWLGTPRATVVLENIEDLSSDLQARVAAALQSQAKGIDRAARVIATSALDLAKGSCAGACNRTLVMQLSSFCIRLPQLPERHDDIPGIAQIIIDSCAESNVTGLMPDAAAILKGYPWLSIDRLKQCVEFATWRASGPKLDVCDLPTEVVARTASVLDRNVGPAPILHSAEAHDAVVLTMSELERLAIMEALRNTHGNKIKAAAALGIGKTTLYRKVKLFGLK